jgi:hypothetical protein
MAIQEIMEPSLDPSNKSTGTFRYMSNLAAHLLGLAMFKTIRGNANVSSARGFLCRSEANVNNAKRCGKKKVCWWWWRGGSPMVDGTGVGGGGPRIYTTGSFLQSMVRQNR